MIACSCPKCSTYGNASYCINDIIDDGRKKAEIYDKQSMFCLNFAIWSAGIVLALPLIIGILQVVTKG
jgi:hypothetical protein